MVEVLDRFDGGVIRKRDDSGMTRLVELDHVDGGFESLFVDGWRERRGVVEADEDANVEKLIFGDREIGEYGTFRGKGERRRSGGQVDGCDELVNAWVKESVSRPKDSVYVRFRVPLEVD